MTATASMETTMRDTSTLTRYVEAQVIDRLGRDRMMWTSLLMSTVCDDLLIPRTSVPHMHPSGSDVPCMVCAAHCRSLTTVSAVVLLSLAELRHRDDAWNSDPLRRSEHVLTASRAVVADRAAVETMFGPHWGAIMALAYRIEGASPVELVSLLRRAISVSGAYTAAECGSKFGRDWTQSARWLISNAMSGRRTVVKTPRVVNHNTNGAYLLDLASVIATDGLSGDDAEDWLSL